MPLYTYDGHERPRFSLDVWDIIIKFIPDAQRRTLLNLSYVSRDLCITLRRRLFRKVTFSLSHRTSQTLQLRAQLGEPNWSPSAKLLPILKANPGLSGYIRHLQIQVLVIVNPVHAPEIKKNGYCDGFSLITLVPYLTNLQCLSFTSKPSTTVFRWSELPEVVRESLHPLLSVVSEINAPDLYDLPSSVVAQSRTKPLRSLSVGMYGLFLDGKRFPAEVISRTTPVEGDEARPSQQRKIPSLTIDSRCDYHHWNPFPHWMSIDNPAFAFTVDFLEELTFAERQNILGPKHGFQHLLRRCSKTLRRLRLPPGFNIEETMRAKLTWKASQKTVFKGAVPDLSSLIHLNSHRMSGYIRLSDNEYFTTSFPFIIATLKTLPTNELGQAPLTELWIDLDLENFQNRERLVKQLDWSQFSDFILHRPQFACLEKVVIEVSFPSTRLTGARATHVRTQPSTTTMDALRRNPALGKMIDLQLLTLQPRGM